MAARLIETRSFSQFRVADTNRDHLQDSRLKTTKALPLDSDPSARTKGRSIRELPTVHQVMKGTRGIHQIIRLGFFDVIKFSASE